MKASTPRTAGGTSMTSRTLSRAASLLVAGVAFAACVLWGSAAFAQTTWTWTGNGGDGNWNNGANWTYNTGTVADPLTGQNVTFAGSTQLNTVNNTGAGGTTSGIRFSAGAGSFTLAGNALTLTGVITNSATTSIQTISLPLNLNASAHTFTTSSGGTTAITSSITGGNAAGSTTISGTLGGVLWLSGSNSFTGNVTMNGGTLLLGHANALSSGTLRLLTGAAAPVVRASSDLTLANNVLLNTGAATFDGSSSLGFGELVQQGGSRTLTNSIAAGKSLTFSGTTFLQEATGGSSRTLTVAGSGNTVFNGAIVNGGTAGSGGLTITNTGTTTLNGINTFTGQTGVDAGVLNLPNVAGLQGTAKVSLRNTSRLDYSGATAAFGRTISSGTVLSGTVGVSNSGGGLLTLSGGVELNGAAMRLSGGQFNITGRITGTGNSSNLIVDGVTATLSNTNSYVSPTIVQGGGTLVLGTSAAVPAGSAVTVDASTLTVGGVSNPIASLTTAGNATIGFAINGGSGGGLSMTDLTLGGGSNTLALTMTSPTAGIYNLLTYSGNKTGSVTATGLDSNYTLLQGAASNGAIAVQRKAEFGSVSASPAAATIITGGSTAFGYTAANITPAGGATLSFASTNGSRVSGASSGSALAAGVSGTVSGLFFTGTTVGLGQTGSFTLTDAAAIGSGTGSVSVNVLDHATPAFATANGANILTPLLTGSITLDFGSLDVAAGRQTLTYSLTNLASVAGSSLTAGLALTGFTNDANGFESGLATFADLDADAITNLFDAAFTPSTEGVFSRNYTLTFYDDQSLSGSIQRRDLTVHMQAVVVPEPGALALAGLGVGVAGWMARIRRRGSRKI